MTTADDPVQTGEEFREQSRIRLASLAPDTDVSAVAYVEAQIALVWPYSSSTGKFSFLLTEADAPAHDGRRQVKVILHNGAARAAQESRMGIGDTLRLSCKGCQWTRSQDVVATPGKKIDYDIEFRDQLRLRILSGDHAPKSVHYEHSSTTATYSNGLHHRNDNNNISLVQDTVIPGLQLLHSTPTAKQTFRKSFGSYLDTTLDPFSEDDEVVVGRSRKRTKFARHSGGWNLVEQAPESQSQHEEVPPSVSDVRAIISLIGDQLCSPTLDRTVEAPETRLLSKSASSEPASHGLQDQESDPHAAAETEPVQAISVSRLPPQVSTESELLSPAELMPPPRTPSKVGKPDSLQLEIAGRSEPVENTDEALTPRLQPMASPGLPLVSPLIRRVGIEFSYFPQTDVNGSELDASAIAQTVNDMRENFSATTSQISGDSSVVIEEGSLQEGRSLEQDQQDLLEIGFNSELQHHQQDVISVSGSVNTESQTILEGPKPITSFEKMHDALRGSFPLNDQLNEHRSDHSQAADLLLEDEEMYDAPDDNQKTPVAANVMEDRNPLDVLEAYLGMESTFHMAEKSSQKVHSGEAVELNTDLAAESATNNAWYDKAETTANQPDNLVLSSSSHPPYQADQTSDTIPEDEIAQSKSAARSPERSQNNQMHFKSSSKQDLVVLSSSDDEADEDEEIGEGEEDEEDDEDDEDRVSEASEASEASGTSTDVLSDRESADADLPNPQPYQDTTMQDSSWNKMSTYEEGSDIGMKGVNVHQKPVSRASPPRITAKIGRDNNTSPLPDQRKFGVDMQLDAPQEEAVQEPVSHEDIVTDTKTEPDSASLPPKAQESSAVADSLHYVDFRANSHGSINVLTPELTQEGFTELILEQVERSHYTSPLHLPTPRETQEVVQDIVDVSDPPAPVLDVLEVIENAQPAHDLEPEYIFDQSSTRRLSSDSMTNDALSSSSPTRMLRMQSFEPLSPVAEERLTGSVAVQDDTVSIGSASRSIIKPDADHEAQERTVSSPTEEPMHTTESRHIANAAERASDEIKKSMTGVHTTTAYYPALASLPQYFGKVIDIIALATKDSTRPEQARHGPKDYFTSLCLTDTSLGEASQFQQPISVQIFRPDRNALPKVTVGEVIVLRDFKVQTMKNKFMLLSTDSSAWAVINTNQEQGLDQHGITISGPPIEIEEGELVGARSLFNWWSAQGRQHDISVEHPYGKASDDASETPAKEPARTKLRSSTRRRNNYTDNIGNDDEDIPIISREEVATADLSPPQTTPTIQRRRQKKMSISDPNVAATPEIHQYHTRSQSRRSESIARDLSVSTKPTFTPSESKSPTLPRAAVAASAATAAAAATTDATKRTTRSHTRSRRSESIMHELRDGKTYTDENDATHNKGEDSNTDESQLGKTGTDVDDAADDDADNEARKKDDSLVHELRDGLTYIDE